MFSICDFFARLGLLVNTQSEIRSEVVCVFFSVRRKTSNAAVPGVRSSPSAVALPTTKHLPIVERQSWNDRVEYRTVEEFALPVPTMIIAAGSVWQCFVRLHGRRDGGSPFVRRPGGGGFPRAATGSHLCRISTPDSLLLTLFFLPGRFRPLLLDRFGFDFNVLSGVRAVFTRTRRIYRHVFGRPMWRRCAGKNSTGTMGGRR